MSDVPIGSLWRYPGGALVLVTGYGVPQHSSELCRAVFYFYDDIVPTWYQIDVLELFERLA